MSELAELRKGLEVLTERVDALVIALPAEEARLVHSSQNILIHDLRKRLAAVEESQRRLLRRRECLEPRCEAIPDDGYEWCGSHLVVPKENSSGE